MHSLTLKKILLLHKTLLYTLVREKASSFMTEATKQVGETTCSYDCKYTFLKVGMLQIFNVYNALPFYACVIHTKEVFSKYFVFLASPNIPQNITTLESLIVYEKH